MKQFWVILLGLLIILIVICNYRVVQTLVDPRDGTVGESDNVTRLDIDITYDKSLSGEAVDEVRRAVSKYPAPVLETFVSEGWKIVLVKKIDLNHTEYEGIEIPMTVGLTNFETKTIQISPYRSTLSNYVYIRTLHEMGHLADHAYGDLSDQPEWILLYEKHRNDYTEFEFYGVPIDEENYVDVSYAVSNRWEMFASVFKDFYSQPEYLKRFYPDLYAYFEGVVYGESV